MQNMKQNEYEQVKQLEILKEEELAQVYEIEEARLKRDARRANYAKDKEKRDRKYS